MTKRVLVAEDEPNIAKSLTYLLERAGYQVSVETDGNRVAQVVQSDPPDALLLDVMLPGTHGHDILRALRGNPETADLPVMILTAKGQNQDRELAMQAGATAFLTKPFSNAEVVDSVQRMLDVG